MTLEKSTVIVYPLIIKVLGTNQTVNPFNIPCVSFLGFYKKPTLNAVPNPVVTLGSSVTASCNSNNNYNGFILIKEKQFFSPMDSQYAYTGQSSASFQVGPITLSERWSLRCYGYYSRNPQILSEGSDILEILVSGKEAQASLLIDREPDTGFPRETLMCDQHRKVRPIRSLL